MNAGDGRNRTGVGDVSVKNALKVLRVVWFALLVGPLGFMGVVISILRNGDSRPIAPQPILNWVHAIMFFTVVPIAFVIRLLIFKRGRVDGRVPAAAYSAGSILFWAACEGSAFLGLVAAQINGSLWPTIVLVAAALSLQAITIPMAGKLTLPSNAGDR